MCASKVKQTTLKNLGNNIKTVQQIDYPLRVILLIPYYAKGVIAERLSTMKYNFTSVHNVDTLYRILYATSVKVIDDF